MVNFGQFSVFRFFLQKRKNLDIQVDQLAYLRCFHPHFPRELELDITDSTVLNQHSNVGDAKLEVSRGWAPGCLLGI